MRALARVAILAVTAASCEPSASTPPAAEPTAPAAPARPIPKANVTPKPAAEPSNTLAYVLAQRDSEFASLRVGEGVVVDYTTQWSSSAYFEPFRQGSCAISCFDDPLFSERVCSFRCTGRDPSRDFAFLAYQSLKASVDHSVPATWSRTEQSGDQTGLVDMWGPSPLERFVAVQLAPIADATQLSIVIESRVPLTPSEREMLGP